MMERRRESRLLLNFTLNFLGFEAETIDISPSGMGILLDRPIETNEKISFSILLPNETLVNLEGIVKWQAMVDDKNYCGVEFVYPDQETIQRLLTLE